MNIPFTDSVIQQARNHMLDQSDISAAQRESVKKVEQNVDALLREFAEAKTHIGADARLVPSAKTADIGKLAQDYAARLQHITDSEVRQIEKRLGELEVQLRPQRPDTNPVVQELREREIRDLLRDKPELELIGSYKVWATEGTDDTAMMAVEGAPQFAPLISDPSILDAGRRARAARQSPEAAALLKQLHQMQALLRNIVQSAEATIDLPPSDPIAAIAAGKA